MTTPTLQMTADERKRSLANLKLERDAIYLYDQLADIEKDPERARDIQRASPQTSVATPRSGRRG